MSNGSNEKRITSKFAHKKEFFLIFILKMCEIRGSSKLFRKFPKWNIEIETGAKTLTPSNKCLNLIKYIFAHKVLLNRKIGTNMCVALKSYKH